ncbi:MAG TPA: hypothetical protein DDY68_04390, partial [Porphyromonadaceae bacterium]|nr:hypothetical protein [Porphyromonadaceae bacterium]
MKREVIISFDNEKCVHCGNCVEECPSGIIMQTKGEVPYVEDVRRCIECGHCVSVCAKEAIHHSDFQQVFSYRSEDLPKAESLLLLMKSRRAIRNFQEKPIPKDILSKIVEAGHTAPTAENSLSVRTLLITDKEKMKEISSFTLNTFGKIMGIVNSPIVKFVLKPLKPELYEKIGELRTMIENFENGKDDVLNGCSALLLFYT